MPSLWLQFRLVCLPHYGCPHVYSGWAAQCQVWLAVEVVAPAHITPVTL
jgi:hypothetical protein